jgi:hypothetical protein
MRGCRFNSPKRPRLIASFGVVIATESSVIYCQLLDWKAGIGQWWILAAIPTLRPRVRSSFPNCCDSSWRANVARRLWKRVCRTTGINQQRATETGTLQILDKSAVRK